jgi:hypothetical protein
LYRALARHLLAIAFVLYVVIAVVQAALVGLLGGFGVLLGPIVGIIAAFLLQAALVKAGEDVRDGRADLSLGGTLQAARPAIWRFADASILAGHRDRDRSGPTDRSRVDPAHHLVPDRAAEVRKSTVRARSPSDHLSQWLRRAPGQNLRT